MMKAVAVLLPLIRAFVIEAEGTSQAGEKKRAAVLGAIEAMWEGLQLALPKQLGGIGFGTIEPYIGVAIDGTVSMFDSLFGQVWSFVENYVIDPIEGWTGVDIDGDGDIDGAPVSFPLKPVEE
jgi:hypothetical protein